MIEKIKLSGNFARFDAFNTDHAISFNCEGAIDFTEQIDICLSNDYIEGYTEESLYVLYHAINNKFISMSNIFKLKFYDILQKSPNFSNKEVKVYYKCERLYKHTHTYYNDPPTVTKMTLNESLYYIIENKLSIL